MDQLILWRRHWLDSWPFPVLLFHKSPALTGADTMATTFQWTGTHVSGSCACAVVRYAGPTNTRGSRWIASIKRDRETTWRASATFEEGPITAALRAATKGGVEWRALTCHSIDADTYCVGF